MGGPTARRTVFQQWRWCLNRHLTVRRRSSAGTLDSAALAECPVSSRPRPRRLSLPGSIALMNPVLYSSGLQRWRVLIAPRRRSSKHNATNSRDCIIRLYDTDHQHPLRCASAFIVTTWRNSTALAAGQELFSPSALFKTVRSQESSLPKIVRENSARRVANEHRRTPTQTVHSTASPADNFGISPPSPGARSPRHRRARTLTPAWKRWNILFIKGAFISREHPELILCAELSHKIHLRDVLDRHGGQLPI
ncbi:hypothetical protein J3F84DRAFT_202574 [Trichoderma pleuroticola]